MSVTCADLSLADIDYVVDNLWERGWREAKVFGYSIPRQVVNELFRLSKEYGYVLFSNDRPFAVFGANETEPGVYMTWLVATEAFTKYATRGTILLSQCIEREMAKRPDIKRLDMKSACDFPNVEKWFKLIGFSRTGKQGPFTYYTYARKNV